MTTATFEKSIAYDRETRDFAARLNGEYIGSFSTHAAAEAALDQVAYDQLADGVALTAAELDGGSDADTMAEEVAAAVVAPNPGVHLNQYTVVLSQPDQTFCYEIKTLCDACRATTPNASKMGEVINACCDACGVGPSVSHFRLEAAPEQLPADWMRMPEGDILDADGMRVSLPSSLCPECQGSGWVPAGECEAYGCREQVTHEQISNRPWTDYAFCCYHFRMNVNGGTCTCGTPPPTRPGLIVAQGHGWRVECNRAGGSFSAIVNGVGCIGRAETPGGAQTLCNTFMAHQRAA